MENANYIFRQAWGAKRVDLFTEARKPVWETLLGCIEFELLIRYSCDYVSWAFGWSGPEFRAKTHIQCSSLSRWCLKSVPVWTALRLVWLRKRDGPRAEPWGIRHIDIKQRKSSQQDRRKHSRALSWKWRKWFRKGGPTVSSAAKMVSRWG